MWYFTFELVSMECRFSPGLKTILMLFLLPAHPILALTDASNMWDHIVIGGFSSSGVLSGGVGGACWDEMEWISDGW